MRRPSGVDLALQEQRIHQLARDAGFDLAGVAAAGPVADFPIYESWTASGYQASMAYLTGRRAGLRADPRMLLAGARSVICVAKLYNTPYPQSNQCDPGTGWISRYGWGEDYHDVLRRGLARLRGALEAEYGTFESKICVDTAPLLERSLARQAGLGWIGKNTCLINQQQGSWFFLGELITSLDLRPDAPPPDRCGTCSRCIDACPTDALVPAAGGGWTLDSGLCISHQTIELRGPIEPVARSRNGHHVFGCDICQEVCPWNRHAPDTADAEFHPAFGSFPPNLAELGGLCEAEFDARFARTPVARARYRGFLRNVVIAMGNQPLPEYRPILERLAAHVDPVVAEHAVWALGRL
ncbi:MAG: tRNA epoxyqueuosine(34) reductase QueG [Bryobacteraceae bacterium]